MTIAPDDLKAVQRYVRDKTGQPWEALGIIHGSPQGGGYHEGLDLLHVAWRSPGRGSDYSWAESERDRKFLADDASAFDIGGKFPRFYEFNRWLVSKCEMGDPRTRDIREVIYTLDGKTVRRWDRLGRRSGGDSSHLTHTHISFFRDSKGRRANTDNFMGLLVQWFENRGEPWPVATDAEEDKMGASFPPRCIPLAPGWDSVTIPEVEGGAADPRPAWLILCNDTNGAKYKVRLYATNGSGWYALGGDKEGLYILGNGQYLSVHVPKGTRGLHISRQPVDSAKPDEIYAGPLTWCLERGAVVGAR